MAKNITLLGASYSDVPAVTLPQTGGGTARFDDASVTTATASDVASGKVFLASDGTITTGTSSGGSEFLITLTLNSSTGLWEPDKTLAQIISAHNNGDTIVLSAVNNDDICPTAFLINEEGTVAFLYFIAWWDYNLVASQDFYCYSDSYEYTSGGLNIYDRQAITYPSTLTTKTITANGTYNPALDGADGYSSVTVNVSGGGSSKNAQTAQSTTRATSSSYTEVISLTCEKSGTYDVYWSTFRSSTSGTWGSQLYIDNTAYGSAQTRSWSNHIQNIHLASVQIDANEEVAVRVRSRGSNYYGYVGTLTIIEQ